jgi:hypothetical protein
LSSSNAQDRWYDADGDGMLNWEEYLAGTDPTDAQSYLRIESITAGSVATVTFHAISNRTYTVECTEAPGDASWFRLADVFARAMDRDESVIDPHYTTNRFYRLANPRRP